MKCYSPLKKDYPGGAPLLFPREALFSRLVGLDVARPAVARTARGMPVGAVGAAVRLAGFVHGAFDAQPLHVLVGRYFGVDVVALDHQGQRHADDEQPDGRDGTQYDD